MITLTAANSRRRAEFKLTATAADLGFDNTCIPCTIYTDLGNGDPLEMVRPTNGDYSRIVYRQRHRFEGMGKRSSAISLIVKLV